MKTLGNAIGVAALFALFGFVAWWFLRMSLNLGPSPLPYVLGGAILGFFAVVLGLIGTGKK